MPLSTPEAGSTSRSDEQDRAETDAQPSPHEAQTWLLNRLGEEALVDHVLTTMNNVSGGARSVRQLHSAALRNFARALAKSDRSDSLSAFLRRLQISNSRQRSSGPDDEPDAVAQLDAYLKPLRSGGIYRGREATALESLLEHLLQSLPEDRSVNLTPAEVANALPRDSRRLRPLLAPRERDLIKSVEGNKCTFPELVFFSAALTLHGHGGLDGWLAMHKDGRKGLAHSLLRENVRSPARGVLSAIERLQKVAGIAPELRVQIQGSRSYTTAFEPGPDLVEEPGTRSGEPASSGPSGSAFVPVTTREEALQWFQNRKDDARLINLVYARDSSESVSQVRRGVRLLRGFMKFRLQHDSNATLRGLLGRFGSAPGSDERQRVHDDVSTFAAGFANSTVEQSCLRKALEELSTLMAEHVQGPNDEESVLGEFGKGAHDLLPPADVALIALLEGHEHRTSAARSFSLALLERGIAGLPEWISMWRDDRKPQAKMLLEELKAEQPRSIMGQYIVTA
ncbi:MAG TPA: hypothetical protein VFP68_18560, partial [Burkholderiaceae bacterium]|nr:hypothetical protein [Burkholderiaceae bacterium]